MLQFFTILRFLVNHSELLEEWETKEFHDTIYVALA
jgi:hypothetical protein